MTPWELKPRTLWSLLEMERYRADMIALVSTMLGEARASFGVSDKLPGLACTIIRDVRENIKKAVEKSMKEQLPPHTNINLAWQFDEISDTEEHITKTLDETSRERARGELAEAVKGIKTTGLPMRWERKITRILESIETSDTGTLEIRIADLSQDLVDELAETLFLFVPAAKRELFEQSVPLFGEKVASKFPSSARDISAAGRCLALDEWTACVCHGMRALEEPLHVIASRLKIEFPKPIEFENWKNIIDKIDSEIIKEVKRLEGTPASQARSEELKLYGDAATQLRHFKNAWRNDAAHGREHYDEKEANRVYSAVKEFMQMMADLI